MKISLERRRTVKPWHLIGVPLLSVIFGTIVGGLFLEATGHNAILVFKTMSETSYTTLYGIGDTLAAATPLIFTALAALVAFRVNLYSIGAEGQLFVGGIFASGVGIAVGNSALAIPAVLIAGIVGGVVWMTLPALFRAWFGTSEIITTLMFNFVALFLMRYLIYGASTYWRDPTSTNFPQGKKLDQNAWLPRFGTQSVHWGLVLALLTTVGIWFLLRKTRFGYQMKVLGDAPNAARYSGVPVKRMTFTVLIISGGLAGLAGASEVAGRAHALDPNGLAIGLGYAGIIVATLARLNPFGAVVIAIGFGGLQNSASALQSLGTDSVPSAIATTLQGLILLLALAGELFVRYRLKISKRSEVAS
jgi:simple sugar transport system permease protein